MNKYKAPFILTCLLLNMMSPNISPAQPGNQRPKDIKAVISVIDTLFGQYMRQNHVPGYVYGLVADGKLVHVNLMGYTDLDKKIRVTNQSLFRIASMTKSFTAMAIIKLRDVRKLNLDDPVYRYIPEMKDQHYLTKDAIPITIRDLLTHAAGFPEDNPWGDRQLAITDEDMIRMIKKGISFSNVPGYGYEYSNMGFAMLGYIIKKITGETYQKYITKNILIPLGMTHTYWDYTKVPSNLLAHGYRWLNDMWIEEPLLKDGAYGAMGGLLTSIEDYSKYINFHLSAWPPRDDSDSGPVRRSSLREMQHAWNINQFVTEYKYPGGRQCAIVTGYGYGLRWVQDCHNRTTIGHSGGLPGFGSDWKILADYGIGIITFTNLTYTSASGMNSLVLDTIISLAGLKPRQLPVSSILKQRQTELIKLLPNWNNAEASRIFAINFFKDYDPETLRKEAVAIFDRAGKIIRINEMAPTNNLRGSFVMEGEKADIEVFFTLTPENPPLIQQFDIREKVK